MQELGELVQLGTAEQPPRRSNSRVVTSRDGGSQSVCVADHCTQLEHAKRPPAPAQAIGIVEDRQALGRCEGYPEKQQWSPDGREQQSNGQVDQADAGSDGIHSRARSSISGSAAGKLATLPQYPARSRRERSERG